MNEVSLDSWLKERKTCLNHGWGPFVFVVEPGFSLNSEGVRSGTGHSGIRDHYLYGVVTANATQLVLRLMSPSYSGRLISSSAPGSPEIWGKGLKVIKAVEPTWVAPPSVPPSTMTKDWCPVRIHELLFFDSWSRENNSL